MGFRPFVFRLAQAHALNGTVFNHDRGVTIEVEGAGDAIGLFIAELKTKAPQAARIDSLSVKEIEPSGHAEFLIKESPVGTANRFVPISADLAICEECREEIHDPKNRRYFYPFANCTNCGPRFSIVQGVPYDRPLTTMSKFAMCESCRREYEDPSDRRFHAQPIACADCGPKIQLVNASNESLLDGAGAAAALRRGGDTRAILEETSRRLKAGEILAVKGIGGFHLACDALNEEAVRKLRSRKVREEKPFAVMFPNLLLAQRHAQISSDEEALLKSSAAPIVVLNKRAGHDLAASVAPNNDRLGVMLPYTPLHELLLSVFDGPIVLTSGNRHDEPIAYTNDAALVQLKGIADAFLIHDRAIHVRCDDSVVRAFDGKAEYYRRSRGYAPVGIRSHAAFAASILAVGSELKNTFCISREGEAEALLSQHIGDLENLSTHEAFETGIAHFKKIFNSEPAVIAHDLHPEYLNSKWVAEKFSGPEWKDRVIGVQHHHAHLAANLEDNGFDGPVLGIALDGTGYGPDGTIWGGEVLLCDRRDYLRVARIRPVRMPGGNLTFKHPWKIALSYLKAAGISEERLKLLPSIAAVPKVQRVIISQVLQKRLNTFQTSSCGRLFDAVSGILGLVPQVRYEGQPAIELERVLSQSPRSSELNGEFYRFAVTAWKNEGSFEIDWGPAFEQIISECAEDSTLDPAFRIRVSLKFHEGLVRAFVELSEQLAKFYDIRTVALSGGCFMNEYLRNHLSERLKAKDLRVLHHERVPTNDGGIAYGQLVVANEIVKGSQSCVSQFQ